MDVFWILFFSCFSLNFATEVGLGGFSIESNDKKEKIELFPPNPTYAGQTRMPRIFFRKLHSGASFLTGLKLGAILSKKGFELGHGKIASAHSFQIFGKPVNSAMSLSYGNAESLLPLVENVPHFKDSLNGNYLQKENKKIQVTVLENSSETVGALRNSTWLTNEEKVITQNNNENDGDGKIKKNMMALYQDPVEEDLETVVKSNFLKEHNKLVKEFNDRLLKRKKQ